MNGLYASLNEAIKALQQRGFFLVSDLPVGVRIGRANGLWEVAL